MFEILGKIKTSSLLKKKIFIPVDEIKEGVNTREGYIIVKKENKFTVYNRICDHAGGKIISKDGNHVCPMHNWQFNPLNGKYSNGVQKKETHFEIVDKDLIIEDFNIKPNISQIKYNDIIKITFFNHAFLLVEFKGGSFITDPWAFGPAFNTGWWLKKKTKKDWLEKANKASFIFISHNHPDHLHTLTLNKINKKIPIVVPNFSIDSCSPFLDKIGFKNISKLDFGIEYKLNSTSLIFSVLKSGDFRYDSGIYFSLGKFTALFDVDSNSINFNRLPNVSLYASSFAGGASGYPLMFDNFSFDEKKNISKKNVNFIKSKKINKLKDISPKYFLPYAGFFKEKLSRDNSIYKNNLKNSILTYEPYCNKNNIYLLNVEKKDIYTFRNDELISTEINKNPAYKDISPSKYLQFFKKSFSSIDSEDVYNYFKGSNFKDDLVLIIELTDDNFKKININYIIDFSKKSIGFSNASNNNVNDIISNKMMKYLYLKIRNESFINTIKNMLPWEDLSIGFQCKVIRNPNEYMVKFWHHFTNVYVSKLNQRENNNCISCYNLIDFFDNEIKEISRINK